MKHGLIFDLDGTLVNSLAGITASLNHALRIAGRPVHPLSAVRNFVGDGAKMLVTRATPPDASFEELDGIEQAFRVDYEANWASGTQPYAGIVELLAALQARDHSLAVLSNKPHKFTQAMVAGIFPAIHFSVVLGQRDGVPHKPDPTGALEIASCFGMAPEECLIIGDSTIDLETAKNAGMRAIAVTWGFHDRDRLAEAHQIADDPTSLLRLLD